MAAKKQYETPALTVVGTFEGITQAAADGNLTDALFPPSTPRGELTFS